MAESSRQKSATPAVAAPAAAATSTLAAPQVTGNAAAQERLGSTAPAPEAADTLSGALASMGDMAGVVLDAMPLPKAFALAVAAGRTTWTEAWVLAQSPSDVLAHAEDLLRAGWDLVWPVGFGATIDATAAAALLVKLGWAGSLGIERIADGMAVTCRGTVLGGLAVGAGAELGGARGDTALGVGAGLEGCVDLGGEATWEFGTGEVLRALLARRPMSMNELLLGRGSVHGVLPSALLALAEGVRPTRWSGGVQGRAEGRISGSAAGLASDEVGGRSAVGARSGQDGDVAYREFSIEGSGAVGVDNKLFELLRKAGLPKLELSVGHRLRLRVSGAEADLRYFNLERLSFSISSSMAIGDTSMEESLETPDFQAAVGWLAALVNPIDSLVGEDGPAVPSSELPEVTLTRTATRVVDDLAQIQDTSIVGELVELVTPDHHAFLVAEGRAQLVAKVSVPVEAVVAAVGGGALAAGPEGIEARVLDVERFLAAEATGGSALRPSGIPALDLEAGVAEVDIPAVDVLLQWEARAGLGAEVGVIADLEVGGHGGVTLSQRGALSPAISAEQRRELFAS